MVHTDFIDVLNDKAVSGLVSINVDNVNGYIGRRPDRYILDQEEERFARIFKKGDKLANENHIKKENWEDAKNKYLRKELSLDELDAYLQRITPHHKRNSIFSGAIDDSAAAIDADDRSRGTGSGQFTKPKRSLFATD